jgi:hypothetical protein
MKKELEKSIRRKTFNFDGDELTKFETICKFMKLNQDDFINEHIVKFNNEHPDEYQKALDEFWYSE